jgi:hypothetical protein
MSLTEIIAELDAEIARLEQAKKLFSNERNARLGSPVANKGAGRRKRRLSPEARMGIAKAQRRRWAALKAKK